MVCGRGTGGHGLKAARETGKAEETPVWHGFRVQILGKNSSTLNRL